MLVLFKKDEIKTKRLLVFLFCLFPLKIVGASKGFTLEYTLWDLIVGSWAYTFYTLGIHFIKKA